ELVPRLAANVGADEVEDRLLAGGLQDRELEPLRHERQSEVEVEDVGAWKEPRKRGELERLPAPLGSLGQVKIGVGLGVGGLRVEDDELRVDALSPQRLHVRPADPREVHGAVNDFQRPEGTAGSPTSPLLFIHHASHSTWSK